MRREGDRKQKKKKKRNRLVERSRNKGLCGPERKRAQERFPVLVIKLLYAQLLLVMWF